MSASFIDLMLPVDHNLTATERERFLDILAEALSEAYPDADVLVSWEGDVQMLESDGPPGIEIDINQIVADCYKHDRDLWRDREGKL